MEELINNLFVKMWEKVNFIQILQEMNRHLKEFDDFNLDSAEILGVIEDEIKNYGFDLESCEARDVIKISKMMMQSFSYSDLRVIAGMIMAFWREVRELFDKIIWFIYIYKKEPYLMLYQKMEEVVNEGIGVEFLLSMLSREYVFRGENLDISTIVQVLDEALYNLDGVNKM